MANVEWTVRAIGDVQSITDYLRRWSDEVAERHKLIVTDAVATLADFPRLGRKIPAFDDDSFRELIANRYRILYRLRGDVVRILAVADINRNIEHVLARRTDDF